MSELFYVTAISQKRRAEWERVFGTDQLPVTGRAPSLSPAGCLSWTLDVSRLHWMQIRRLVQWLVKRDGLRTGHAEMLIAAGLPIPASEASLVHEFEQDVSPHPAFRLWWARPLTLFCYNA